MQTIGLVKGALELISLRTGEGRRALLAATYLFLIIASYLALKPVRDALFIDQFGALSLPYVTIAYALAAGIFVTGYTRLSQRFPTHVLTIGTLLFFVSNLLLFWWFARLGVRWLYPVLYVWVGMYGAIAPAQVWTIAGDLFTVREAKRSFGLIGGGGILGGIVGPALTGWFALAVGTINVLLFVCVLLILAVVVVYIMSKAPTIHRESASDEIAPRRISESLKLIAHSSHLRAIAGLVFVTALATTLIDWQFKTVAGDRLSGDQLTAFFSVFFSVVNTISISVQIMLTSRLIRWVGIGTTLLVLPVSLLAGAGSLLIKLRLWAATFAKGAEQALKHSLDRASRELLYLPLSPRLKLPVKSAIDMVVDRLGDGTAGALILIVIFFTRSDDPMHSVVNVGLISAVLLATWIFLVVRLRASYRSELSRSIAMGSVEISTWSEALAGSDTLPMIEKALESPQEEVVLEALDLVARNPQWPLERPLLRLLRDGSDEVQARVMSILMDPSEESLPSGLAQHFGLADQEILAECLDILLAEEESEKRERIEHLLERAGGTARGTWIVLLVRRLGAEYVPFAQKLISSLLDESSPSSARQVAAAAIGNMPRQAGMHRWLPDLLKDDDLEVAAAAAMSVGSLGGAELLEGVIPLLGHTTSRTAARRALQRRGAEAVPLLVAWATDPERPETVRTRIPSVLAGIGSSDAIAGLIRLLYEREMAMIEAASYALQRLGGVERGASPATVVENRALEIARASAEFATLTGGARAVFEGEEHASAALLLDALDQYLERSRKVIFRLLCLLYTPRRIIPPWRGLRSGDPVQRANAAELLESLPPRRLWRSLLPVLTQSVSPAPAGGDHDREAILAQIAQGPCRWASVIGRQLARELGAGPDTEGKMAVMSVVDKVIALKKVDVFGEIPGEELARIADLALKVEAGAGDYLCRQDDPAGDLFVVLEGRVALERDGTKIGTMEAGEALGAWGLFEDEGRQASARTETDAVLLRIDRWGFDELLNEHPEIARSFIRHLVRRMRRLAGR